MNPTLDKRAVIEAILAEFESSRGSRIWTDYVNALRLVSQVVFTRSSGFVLEFIQNAEDAGQGLAARFKNIVPVDQLNHGYDMEAEEADGKKVHLEVKGLTAEGNVELTGNEAKAARIHGQSFYLCVVSGIPDTPAFHLVRDPDRVGEKDKLTIKAADWKRERVHG